MMLDRMGRTERHGDNHIVAGMATMPSRMETFPTALKSVMRQVDRLYLYLDGHEKVPDFVLADDRIVPILSRDAPGLRGNGKYLGMLMEEQRGIYLGVDDDIYYGRNFATRLASTLARYDGRAVVGLHGGILKPDMTSYFTDRQVLHFKDALPNDVFVDVLGSGVSAIDTRVLHFDITTWPRVNMIDLSLASEAAKLGLPMICVKRPKRTTIALALRQNDSVVGALIRDDREQTELARALRAVRLSAGKAAHSESRHS